MQVDGYWARADEAAGGVLVLHAWWGLTPFLRRFCDRLASEGWIVLAPDLYHGATAATIAEAERLRSKLKGAVVQQEITTAMESLREACSGLPVAPAGRGGPARIGLVGFSLGGYWGMWLTEQPSNLIDAAVLFYASRGGDFATGRAACQFHLAEHDEYMAASGVKKMQKAFKAAGRETEFYTYPGTSHWFFEDDRPEYDREAAALAWPRAVGFLHAHLAPPQKGK